MAETATTAATATNAATGNAATSGNSTEQQTVTATQTAKETTDGQNPNSSTPTTEALERVIQSRVDKALAEMGKTNADLKKQLDKMKREKLTEDEARKLELDERDKAMQERERALSEKENRLYAIKAIKEIGLDDGSDKALEIVDLVMADNTDAIDAKVKAFNNLVKRIVASEVDKTFKAHGRTPETGTGSSSAGSTAKTPAERLGEIKAARDKKSNDVLSHYMGGKKK